jgi:predicted TIM-barrel fold metal-dependent hydrolase
MLIDAHVHLRSGKLSRIRPRISAEEALRQLVEDMEVAGVDTSLLVTWPEDVPVVARAATAAPGKLYCLVWFDSRQPAQSLQELISLCDQFPSVVVGAKTVFPYLRQSVLQNEFLPFYAVCQERRLPVQFHCGGNPVMEALCHPALFALLARVFPRLTIVCLHAGGGWHRDMPALLRAHRNVHLEVEGLQLHEVQLGVPPQVLSDLLERWGSSRVMFGSDRLAREEKYFRRVEAVKAIPAPHGEDLSYRSASQAYRLWFDRSPGPTRLI